MKFNVFLKNNHGSHWVLSDSSPLFESSLFKTRSEAIGDLEQFVTLMESPSFIESGKNIDSAKTENSPSVLVVFKQQDSYWHWELFISTTGQTTKISESSGKGFESLELAKQKAKYFCDSVVDAPILDQANIAIPGPNFSKSFESAYKIGDSHPSTKWFK